MAAPFDDGRPRSGGGPIPDGGGPGPQEDVAAVLVHGGGAGAVAGRLGLRRGAVATGHGAEAGRGPPRPAASCPQPRQHGADSTQGSHTARQGGAAAARWRQQSGAVPPLRRHTVCHTPRRARFAVQRPAMRAARGPQFAC